jgi:serine/threonine protein kinase
VHHRGSLVLIMELLSGRTVYDALRESRSVATPRQRLQWLSEITEGLAYLHEREIVHRDLSPRNCLFRQDATLAIGDFGVARRMDDQTLTTFHERMGSLIYISPQQREDPHSAKFTDDVFALGQAAYHVLTGRSPHGGIEGIAELGYPVALDVWVRNCREPDASRRPRTATECLLALENLRIDDGSLPQALSDIVV